MWTCEKFAALTLWLFGLNNSLPLYNWLCGWHWKLLSHGALGRGNLLEILLQVLHNFDVVLWCLLFGRPMIDPLSLWNCTLFWHDLTCVETDLISYLDLTFDILVEFMLVDVEFKLTTFWRQILHILDVYFDFEKFCLDFEHFCEQIWTLKFCLKLIFFFRSIVGLEFHKQASHFALQHFYLKHSFFYTLNKSICTCTYKQFITESRQLIKNIFNLTSPSFDFELYYFPLIFLISLNFTCFSDFIS